MPHAYTEDQLVEQPAKRAFAELGWSVAQPHPHLGPLPEGEEVRSWVDETGFGRETKGEVVLVPRLRKALEKLNPALPPEAIAAAIDELTRDRSAMLLEQANREVYRLLKEGIPVSVADTGDSTPLEPRSSGRESAPSNPGMHPHHPGPIGEARVGEKEGQEPLEAV